LATGLPTLQIAHKGGAAHGVQQVQHSAIALGQFARDGEAVAVAARALDAKGARFTRKRF